ncbi:mevalonate diphosphate decarboxylase isoform X2 [Nomia melanderi]|nr:diphosphomevalonate decarboxylase isoform X2 [Nomia melanderi]
MASPRFKEDCIWLNGKEEDIRSPRLQNCLTEIRKRAGPSNKLGQWKVHISSENNFPTAAGLASSAAGYACLVAALAKLYEVEGDISSIARVGSGSACRSVLGGFVRWHMGSDPNGTDSIAKQIAPASYWPEMRIIILVLNDAQKKVSSAIGMKRSMETSELLKYRVKHIVPIVADKMQQAIIKKDFKTFAELSMKDSNQMHATALDTYPPCIYMNDISHAVVDLIHSYNNAVNEIKVAYTYDAGPNTTLYLLEKDVPTVMGVIDHFFPPLQDNLVEYKKGLPIETVKPSQNLLNKMNIQQHAPGCFKYIIYTQVGDGPKYLKDPKDHLLNNQGLPVKHV